MEAPKGKNKSTEMIKSDREKEEEQLQWVLCWGQWLEASPLKKSIERERKSYEERENFMIIILINSGFFSLEY